MALQTVVKGPREYQCVGFPRLVGFALHSYRQKRYHGKSLRQVGSSFNVWLRKLFGAQAAQYIYDSDAVCSEGSFVLSRNLIQRHDARIYISFLRECNHPSPLQEVSWFFERLEPLLWVSEHRFQCPFSR